MVCNRCLNIIRICHRIYSCVCSPISVYCHSYNALLLHQRKPLHSRCQNPSLFHVMCSKQTGMVQTYLVFPSQNLQSYQILPSSCNHVLSACSCANELDRDSKVILNEFNIIFCIFGQIIICFAPFCREPTLEGLIYWLCML